RALAANDRDPPVLERLAESLEARALELRELVQEQHTVVGERGLARARRRAAAHESRRRDRVMRRAKRPPRDQTVRAKPGDAVDAGHLDRLAAAHRRKDRYDPPGEHRLAG